MNSAAMSSVARGRVSTGSADRRERPRAPLPVRGLNALGRGLGRLGIEPVSLDPERALARAEASSSAPLDPAVREAVRRLLGSAASQPRLTTFGRAFLRRTVAQRLGNHAAIQSTLAASPAILREPIVQPWFIVALPRTGTTLLHRLLAQDPAHRVPRQWEMDRPCPPPERATYERDPRIASVDRDLAILHRLAPGFRAIHAIGAAEPEECINLFANDLRSVWFLVGLDLPEYAEWLYHQDLAPLYARHRLQLQLLGWRCRGERWVLKAPMHLLGLAAILSVYPDARIVMTHRDPVSVVLSEASLFRTMREAFHDHVRGDAVGREMLEHLGEWTDAALRARDAHPGTTFVDLSYRALTADPMAAVREIYARFGATLSGAAEQNMQRWLRDHPQHAHGRHEYTAQEFGLPPERIRERFGAYRERFGTYLETGAAT